MDVFKKKKNGVTTGGSFNNMVTPSNFRIRYLPAKPGKFFLFTTFDSFE